MYYKVLACKVLARELYSLAAVCENRIDILWLKQALHNEPRFLKDSLQEAIDRIDAEEESYDAILLGYGLCSNGVLGLKSDKHTLVIPRAHDCITLLLGSKEKYADLFNSAHGGIYWYSPGWIEHSQMPGKERVESLYEHYLEKYGEDNAQYLLEMEQGWLKEYSHAKFIDWPEMDNKKHIDYTRACAQYLDWQYETVPGSPSLLSRMLAGRWDARDFLVIPPGKTLAASFDEAIIKAEPLPESE